MPEHLLKAVRRLWLRGWHDWQIAERLKISEKTVERTRRRLGLRRNAARAKSVCWDCKHAYALKCFAVPFTERSWVLRWRMVRVPHVKGKKGKNGVAHLVLACRRFERDEPRAFV